ncbi:hypothetical protein ABPG72_003624 [Tetrahymena utriculariae]
MFNDFVSKKKNNIRQNQKYKGYSFQPLNTRQRSFDRNKIAFYHNLSKKQCTMITESDTRQNTQQQIDEIYSKKILKDEQQLESSNYLNNNMIKVICKYRKSAASEQKIEIIEKEGCKLELYDQKLFTEIQCDSIFKENQTNTNKEIWLQIKQGIEESIFKKQNYTLILHGSSKTGKNTLLLNKPLLNLHNSTMQIDDQIIEERSGLLERTVNHLLINYNNQQQYEILVSVIGFYEEKAIDLLNLEQDISGSFFTLLKPKKEQKLLMIENLIQMGIRNITEYVSVFIISDFLKKRILDELDVKITSVIYQIAVAKMSKSRDQITQVIQKFNFLKISNGQQTALSRSNLNYCIEKIASNSNQFIPYKDSRLTAFLEDTLTKQSVIHLIPCITDKESVKQQLPTFSLIHSAQKHTQIKKHYIHDPEIVAKVYTQDILEVKDIVSQFENGQNIMAHNQQVEKSEQLPYLANKEEVKKFLGVVKNNKYLQEYKSSAMVETESYIQKRNIRSNSSLADNRDVLNMTSLSALNNDSNNYKKYLGQLNQSLNVQNIPYQQTLLDFQDQFKPFSLQETLNGQELSNAQYKKRLSSCERTQQIYRKQYFKQNKIYLEPISNISTKRNSKTNALDKSNIMNQEDKNMIHNNSNV